MSVSQTTARIGMAIRLLRQSRHMTQDALAQASGLGRPAISSIEHGHHETTLSALNRIASALHVRLSIRFVGAGVEILSSYETLSPYERLALEAIRKNDLATLTAMVIAIREEKPLPESDSHEEPDHE